MKRIGGNLFNELKKKSNHLVFAFLLTRADGVQMGFTSGDTEFEYQGITYSPTQGMMASASASKQNLSVDNISVTSLIKASVSEADLRSGRFDNAHIKVFQICPDHPEYGVIPIRGGRFGELTVKNNQFEVELRSLAWFLQQPFGEFYALECSTTLGSSLCKVNLSPTTWQRNTGYVARAGQDAGIGSWVMPTVENGFWYWCTTAKGEASGVAGGAAWQVAGSNSYADTVATLTAMGFTIMPGFQQYLKTGVAGGAFGNGGTPVKITQNGVDITGSYVNSALYLTPTKQNMPPASAPLGLQPITITTHSARIVLQMGRSGGNEPAWPAAEGAVITDGELVWKAYRARSRRGAVTGLFNKGQFEANALAGLPAGFFKYATLEWTSGLNQGFKMEVRDHLLDPKPALHLLEQMPFKIGVGDQFNITVGCARTRGACKAFENINNMRAQPDMPTEDRALQTPNFQQQGTQADTGGGGGS